MTAGATADRDGLLVWRNIAKGLTLVISAAGYTPQEMVVGDAGMVKQ